MNSRATGEWIIERKPDMILDRLAVGLLGGIIGRVLFLLSTLFLVVRQSIVDDVMDSSATIDASSELFWRMIGGTALFGCLGAAIGITCDGDFRWEIASCAVHECIAGWPGLSLRNPG